MKDVDIQVQDISKIEGHASLDIQVREGKVKHVQLMFTENKRFFTQAIRGRSIDVLAQSVARICGTCSIAHSMCCIEAIEKALEITPSEQTQVLKKLTMDGLMIRDHALHIYLFSLPDVFSVDSVLDFTPDNTKYLNDAFDIKRAGNKLSTIVAGRAVHAPYPGVGGYAHTPTNAELKSIIPDLKLAREKLVGVLEEYYNCPVDYTRSTDFVALSGDKFDFLEGDIVSSDGDVVKEKDYFSHLQKNVVPYSQSVGYKFEGDTYMVGALARINLNKKGLHSQTRKDAKKYLRLFPSKNIFHNNIAQGIEIMHCIDHALETIDSFDFKPETKLSFEKKSCEGVGVIEAPRGTLYYHVDMDSNGIIKEGNIIVPTQQNQINMEQDIAVLVERLLNTHTKEQMQYEIEKLVRAYDPCISCATHFLEVNWT
jgi:coenzyme F420-reducing hydrogenase alpha subunit